MIKPHSSSAPETTFSFRFSHVVRLCRDMYVCPPRPECNTCEYFFHYRLCRGVSLPPWIILYRARSATTITGIIGVVMVSATVDFHPPFPVLRKHFHLRSGSPQHTFSSCQDNDTPARASFFHICTLLCSAKHRTPQNTFERRKRCACFKCITGLLFHESQPGIKTSFVSRKQSAAVLLLCSIS